VDPEENALEEEDAEMEEPDNLEKKIEKLEEKLENVQSDQKNLFLIIFQRFIMLLSEHIQSCEIKGKSFKNHWFRWCIGRLQQIFYEVRIDLDRRRIN
jgi:nuclear cap-binding protein subunit 1